MNKKLLSLSIIFLFVSGLSYAGELLSKEAINYYNEGVELQKAGNFAEAEVLYQKTLLVDPYNPDWQKFILNNCGIIYAQQGDLEKAEVAFNDALKIDHLYITPQLNLGFIYEKRRTRLESIEYWLKILNIDLNKIKPKDFVIEEEQRKAEAK